MLFVFICIGYLLCCGYDAFHDEDLRINIRSYNDYGTSSNESTSNHSRRHPLKCTDTAQMILSHLSVQEAFIFGLTNRGIFQLFKDCNQELIDRMKNMDVIYRILAKDQPCFDRKMLKLRLDETPCYVLENVSEPFSMNDLFPESVSNKILRVFDSATNTNYFGAVVVHFKQWPCKLETANLYLSFKFDPDGFDDAFESNHPQNVMVPMRASRLFDPYDVPFQRNKSMFLGDLLLDDGYHDIQELKEFVLSQSQNVCCLYRGVRKIRKRYLVSTLVILPIPWLIEYAGDGEITGTEEHKLTNGQASNLIIYIGILPIISLLAAAYPGCRITPLLIVTMLFLAEYLWFTIHVIYGLV